jgi:hypothetical protein
VKVTLLLLVIRYWLLVIGVNTLGFAVSRAKRIHTNNQ